MQNENSTTAPIRVIRMHSWIGVAFGIVILLLFFYFFISPPTSFPQGSVVTISSGENLNDIVQQFRNDHIIRSSIIFQSFVIVFGGEKRVIAGDYLLKEKESVFGIAWRIVQGDFGMVEVKVTIPEGFSVSDIGDVLEKKLVQFDKYQFLTDAEAEQGYLFPDTYFFPPTATSSQIISRMRENFDTKITPFLPAIATSTHTESEIITMASILEAEATSTTDRQIIAGILWRRLATGLALQVDSAPDTYQHQGLPKLPINNPGLNSISAALNPIKTKYVYYLSGKDGVTHYAVTFAEHQRNIEKYLK